MIQRSRLWYLVGQRLIVSGSVLVGAPYPESVDCLDLRQLESTTGHPEFSSIADQGLWASGDSWDVGRRLNYNMNIW